MEQSHQEVAALLFGAVIVVFFSYERFNQTTYKTGTRLERLITLLSPEKLRARKVVMRVWAYYCFGLLVLYATLCVYFDVLKSVLPIEDQGGSAGAQDTNENSIGIPPSVSLSIALILTGLAPSVPVLKRFEEWGRVTAHRVAGIPTRVLNDTDILRRKEIDLTRETTDSLLIPKGDWERRAFYKKAAADQVSDPEDFGRDLDLVISISAWILERRLQLENAEFRDNFDAIEEELRKRKDILFLELDERSGFMLGGHLRPPPAPKEASESENPETSNPPDAGELRRKSWDKVASDVDKLAEDMCILLSLYVEHGLVPNVGFEPEHTVQFKSSSSVSENGAGAADYDPRVTQRKLVRQHDIAAEKLCRFLNEIREDVSAPDQLPSAGMRAFLWSASVIMFVTIVWSFGPGHFELGLRDAREAVPWGERVYRFSIIAINTFIVPLGVFILLRDTAKQAHRWHNPWRVHWTTFLPQLGFGLLVSWLVCMMLLIAVSLWIYMLNDKLPSGTLDNALKLIERDYLAVFRGCLLALFVVLLLDGRAAQLPSLSRSPSWKSSLQWGLVSAFLVGIIGALARYTQSLASARQYNVPLDEIDRGLIFYATVYSLLIGFLVILILSEVLLNQRQSRRRDSGQYAANPAE